MNQTSPKNVEASFVDNLVSKIERLSLPVSSESKMQISLEDYLIDWGISYEREVTIDKNSRIDFLVEGSIGIELKTKQNRSAIFKQIKRYCECTDIKMSAIILVTNTFMGMPEAISGIPVHNIWIGKNNL